jgi:hypothetical protein
MRSRISSGWRSRKPRSMRSSTPSPVRGRAGRRTLSSRDQRWLNGLEPAWTMLDLKSVNTLRKGTLVPARAGGERTGGPANRGSLLGRRRLALLPLPPMAEITLVDVTGAQRRDQELLEPGDEDGAVDRPRRPRTGRRCGCDVVLPRTSPFSARLAAHAQPGVGRAGPIHACASCLSWPRSHQQRPGVWEQCGPGIAASGCAFGLRRAVPARRRAGFFLKLSRSDLRNAQTAP